MLGDEFEPLTEREKIDMMSLLRDGLEPLTLDLLMNYHIDLSYKVMDLRDRIDELEKRGE